MSTVEIEVVEEVVSPYIPGTNIQFAWDATSIEQLKRCATLRNYNAQGWRPKAENIHLRFGSEYHRSLQDYEILRAEGFDHRDCLLDVIRSLLFRIQDFESDNPNKNRETLVRTVIWYLEKHKDDPAKTWIMTSGKPAVEINFNFPLDYGPTPDQPYVLCGKLDRVCIFNGDLFINDHKTTKYGLTEWYWKQFNPNTQMSLYTLAGKIVFKAPIKGVLVDAAQVLVGGTNFDRHIEYRTEEQLDEWLADLKYHLRFYEACVANDYWPHNDSACDKYGGCAFRDYVCSKSPQVRDKMLKSNFVQEEPWNPLRTDSLD